MRIAGYILAGGENRRMGGRKKLFLEYGGEPFYCHILRAFRQFPATYLSVENAAFYKEIQLPLVEDARPGTGPMGGILSGLESCPEDALFVAACDMPLVDRESVELIVQAFWRHRGIVAAAADGRLQPLFGIYPKSVLPVLETMIQENHYRMTELLARAGYTAVPLPEGSNAVRNINTPEAYQKLRRCPGNRELDGTPFVFAVSGYKNSGKTTLITRLVPELSRRGYRVAVIKHDGHDFTPDVPGTDSYRYQAAGAYGTAVYSGRRFLVTKQWELADERFLIKLFPEADIILIEGMKHSAYPKYICKYPQEEPAEASVVADEMERLMQSRLSRGSKNCL